MRKNSAHNTTTVSRAPSFLDFWQIAANELGNSRLKINRKVNSIKHLIDRNSDPKDYLKSVIHESYKRSNCRHLKDPIDLATTLDILGETALKLAGQQADDLLDIELLEEIAWLISERYWGSTDAETQSESKSATVVSLQKTKILRANSDL